MREYLIAPQRHWPVFVGFSSSVFEVIVVSAGFCISADMLLCCSRTTSNWKANSGFSFLRGAFRERCCSSRMMFVLLVCDLLTRSGEVACCGDLDVCRDERTSLAIRLPITGN